MTPPAARPEPGLKKNSLGVAGIVFFVVAAAAPLAASVGTAPIAFAFGGPSAPLAYLVVGAVLLLFSVGYARMSRHVTSAAGLAAFVERALGREAGFGFAFVAALSYGAIVTGVYGAFGFFLSFSLEARFGVHVSWFACTAGAWLLVNVLGYLAVALSARVLGVLLVLETAILVVFDVVSTARGGADGVRVDSLDPSQLASGTGLGIALLFAAGAFIGFEATAIYGEEAKAPRRTVAIATYVSVLIIAVFYTVTMWALGNAYGSAQVVQQASDNPGGFVLDAITSYLGTWTADVTNALIVSSYFAGLLALHNTLARYVMSLGRAGGLPKALGGVHHRWRSPHVASVAVGAVTAVVVTGFALGGADPFLQLFAWCTGLATIGIFVLQAGASLAVVVYFRRRGDRPAWATTIAPACAFLGICAVIVLGLRNWDVLSGATEGLATMLPWLILVAAVLGVGAAIVRRQHTSSLSEPDLPPETGTGVVAVGESDAASVTGDVAESSGVVGQRE